MNSLAKKFCLVGVGVGGNFVWYLNVLVIFMGLHGEGRGFKVSIWGPQSGGSIFIGEAGLTLATYCLKYAHTVPL